MHIQLLAVSGRQPVWVQAGFNEYARRLPSECRLELAEIRPGAARKHGDTARAVAEEGARLLAALAAGVRVIALDVNGKSFSTASLARQLQCWLGEGRDLAMLIGGPDGLAAPCLERAEFSWSLSPLTLPHGLVRVVVAEQLYRAWTILKGHPYHRA